MAEPTAPTDITDLDDPLADRHDLYRRAPFPTLAFSADGTNATISTALHVGFTAGDLVVVEPNEADPVVMQVVSTQVVERSTIEFEQREESTDADDDGGAGSLMRLRPVVRSVLGDARVLGTMRPATDSANGTAFERGRAAPFGESRVRPASADEARTVFGPGAASGAVVGTACDGTGLPVELRTKGFSRHTFLCGQSGSGKTYTTGVILETLRLATTLPMVILDPNSDYVKLGAVDEGADPEFAEAYRQLPEPPVVVGMRGSGADVDLVIHLSDFNAEMIAALLEVDPVDDLDEFSLLVDADDQLRAPWGVDDLTTWLRERDDAGRRLARRIDNMGLAGWSLWTRPGEESVVDGRLLDHHIIVFDLGSLTDPGARTLLSAVVMRTLWVRRRERRSRLIVVDEAHNVLPAVAESRLAGIALDSGVSIAAEGRKFGLHLLVATQRPGKVSEQVLSQCDNLVLLHMNSRLDVDQLAATFSHVPSGLIARSPTLTLGQVLYAGPIAPIPVFAQTRRRVTPEGGADLPTTWASRG